MSDSAIDVGAQSHIECPIALRDGVLQIERNLLHIRSPVEWEDRPGPGEIEGKQQRARSSQGHAAREAVDAIAVREGWEERRICKSEVEILGQERVLKCDACFDVVG
jgi:hypothetical protein